MTRIYGSRYAETAALDLPAVARLIRADLKTAAADPAHTLHGLKLSVRCRNGTAIDVAVDGLTDDEIFYLDEREQPRPTVRASEVRASVQAITWAYNYDASDPASDYWDKRFGSHVSLVTDDERTYRASMAALKTRR